LNPVASTGLEGFRIDGQLEGLNQLIDFYISAPERVKASNRKVLATGPLTLPDLFLAAGVVPCDVSTREPLRSILGNREDMVQYAVNAGLSPEFGPWHLVMLGAILSGQNDLPIDMYSTTCGGYDDQLTKSFQMLSETTSKPFHCWEIPKYDAASERWAMDYLLKEVEQLLAWISVNAERKFSEDELKQAIHAGNLVRADLAELDSYVSMPRTPIGAMEYSIIRMMAGDCAQDPVGLHAILRTLIDALKLRAGDNHFAREVSATPVRIYLTGDEPQDVHLFNSIEDYGGTLVGSGFRWPSYYDLIKEEGDLLRNVAGWLWRMPNNFSVRDRIKAELSYIRNKKPDAVIVNSLVGSRNLPGTERLLRDSIKQELGIPVLAIETSLFGDSRDKVDYQIRALLETMV
jgi:benzoyl-CoA reductase/2-hydroxyglutaryl-CoA dehydratase subunit BcrC/BadD/HgdB